VADVLIRDVPEDVLAAIDEQARRLSLSRSEYLRRRLAAEVARGPVTVEDLAGFAHLFSDLNDPEVMSSAWT
jgi:hypothetical protein